MSIAKEEKNIEIRLFSDDRRDYNLSRDMFDDNTCTARQHNILWVLQDQPKSSKTAGTEGVGPLKIAGIKLI